MQAHPQRRSAAPRHQATTRPPVDIAQQPHDKAGRSSLVLIDGFSVDLVAQIDGGMMVLEMKRYSDADCHKLREQLAAYGVFLMTKDAHNPAAVDRINTAIRLILVTVDKIQRKWIGERIRAAKRAQKARGEYSGQRAPFGFAYDANHNLVPEKKQQQTVRLIRKLYEKGQSPRKISADLAIQGIRLSHVTIAKILKHQHKASAQPDK
jgi:DNA invertase Pin-like site-specific DNA recombinase